MQEFLDYTGLAYFLNKLKALFILKPSGSAGLFLKLGSNNSVEWASLPSMFTYKGNKASLELIEAEENPSVGDVWHVSDGNDTGAEYYWNGTLWEYMGKIVAGTNTYNTSEAASSTSIKVGGIESGTRADALDGMTISAILDTMLFPDAEPTHSDESITLNYSGSLSVRYGTTAPAESAFSYTVNLGTWNYYSDTSNYAGNYSVGSLSGTFSPSKLTANTTYSQSVTFTSTGAGTPTTKKGVDRSSKKYNKSGANAVKSDSKTISVWKPYFIGKVKVGYNPASDLEWFNESSSGNIVSKESSNATYTGLKEITGDVTGGDGHIFIAVPSGSAVAMYDPGFTDVSWTVTSKGTKTATISTGVTLSYDVYVKAANGTDTKVYIKTN